MPVVRLISVQPSSEVKEGNSLRVTLEIDSPVSAGDPGLTGGRLIGGIRAWDSWGGSSSVTLIAFAFWPGDKTDVVSYSVQVVDDDGAVITDRTIRIDINSAFAEYTVGSPAEATVRVLDRDSTGPPSPPPENTPTPTPSPTPTPTATPTPTPTPTATPTPTPPTPADTPTPRPSPPPPPPPPPPPLPPTNTPTPTPTPSPTPTPTATATPTPTPFPRLRRHRLLSPRLRQHLRRPRRLHRHRLRLRPPRRLQPRRQHWYRYPRAHLNRRPRRPRSLRLVLSRQRSRRPTLQLCQNWYSQSWISHPLQ